MKKDIAIFFSNIFNHDLCYMLRKLFVVIFGEAGLNRSHVSMTLPFSLELCGCHSFEPTLNNQRGRMDFHE